MSFLGGAQKTQAAQQPAASGVQFQTSTYGKVITIAYGTVRLSPNILWYGDFTATQQQSAGASGGKGGVGGGGGGKGGGGSSQYLYTTSVQFALCEGPIQNVGTVWKDKNITTLEGLGFTLFEGTYPQEPWGYMLSNNGGTSLQTQVPPSPGPYTVTVSTSQNFISDNGVTGAPALAQFTRVTSSPAANQYTGALYNAVGSITYTFNAADAGKRIIVNYIGSYGVAVSEEATIPNTAPYELVFWGPKNRGSDIETVDLGITATNIGYTPVVGAPAANQYSVSNGVYTFNSANAGASITISYAAFSGTANSYQALPYNGIAHVDVANYDLGNSPQLSNHNFEVFGVFSNSVAGFSDADPSLVVEDILSNAYYGAGFPSSKIGSLTLYQNFTIASGLLLASVYAEETTAADMLNDIAKVTISEFVWSSNSLTIVPYATGAITGNGYTYTPPTAPLYDLDDDDYISDQGEDPIKRTRKRISDSLNSIKLEFKNRDNEYNIDIAEAKDQASIDEYGLRQNSSSTTSLFSSATAANTSVQLQLARQIIQNYYEFTTDQRYILLDPMDIITITDSRMGLAAQWVRILEITENDDATLTFMVEEVLDGLSQPAANTFEASQGHITDYNSDPGLVNTPVLFEPEAELAEALEVWMAVSGGINWGGANVYISTDNITYQLAGRVNGGARTGVLTASIPSYTEAVSGPTIDPTSTLSVNLAQSRGKLLSGTQEDALNLSTLCYVDGEYIAYQGAELTALNNYDLTYLVRGAYESDITSHDAGAQFCRMDDALFKYPFAADRIGQTIYIKFTSFNIYGGGLQSLAEVSPFTYVIQGTAYSSPLPDVVNTRLLFVADIAQIVWDEVQDFRPVLYEIRKGSSFENGQVIGRYAHPPFNLLGDGTYWISAYSQPVPGLQVYSENPQGIIVVGTAITQNIIASWDEKATGWTGTFGGSAGLIGTDVVTGPSGDILTDPDILTNPDVLTYGGIGDGTYTIPASHYIDVGRVVPCAVLINWTSFGQNTTEDILDSPNILDETDILDFQSTAQTDVYPEISLSQDGVTWSDWQKYVAGVYSAKVFKARVQLKTLNPAVRAYLSEFTFSVDVPDRIDHYVGESIASGGTNLVFSPDNLRGTPTPFNGGPPSSPTVPAIAVTIWNASAGDVVVLTNQTLSGCTIQVLNSSGVGISKTVTIVATGY